ncbi:MAG: hypothetical protein PF489_06275 [Salinivirgaceae bacterium]|jgi:hypothetical protein|nr:hypothetical protein [Salinivirgaceae bacterium]
MEQKDYILREIEKIGKIIIAIQQKLFSGEGSSSASIENETIALKAKLLKEVDFDLEKFLQFDSEASNDYLNCFKGFSIENIEILAGFLSQIGFSEKTDQSKKYLEKSLQLYEIINLRSKTFSFDRETKIQAIKNAL